jgi:uroporphyrinogen-III synthase
MRILVTRSQEDSERTAERLVAKGHEALIAPTTRIVPTGEPQPAGPFEALVVTSAHAAEALSSVTNKQCPVFAVGPHTASAVRDAGFRSVRVADGDAKSLSWLIRSSLEPGLSLLHVTGRHHKDEPAASLRASGFQMQPWEAYEAKEAPGLPSPVVEAVRTGQVGAALHYSRRSAAIFLRLAGEAGLTSTLRTFPHLCLSADVATAFEGSGMTTVSASRPDEQALFGMLDGLP